MMIVYLYYLITITFSGSGKLIIDNITSVAPSPCGEGRFIVVLTRMLRGLGVYFLQ